MLQRLATDYYELEQQLNLVQKFNYPPEYEIRKGGVVQQAEDLAQDARRLLGVGAWGPLGTLRHMLEYQLGLRVFVRPLRSSLSGLYAYDPIVGGCILLNAKHPPSRRLWTLAHEFGHFLTARLSADVVRYAAYSIDTERFANLFAGALLMPAMALRRRYWGTSSSGGFSTRSLVLLAHEYSVSLEAMARRLTRLNLVADGTYEMLREQGLNEEVVQEILGDIVEGRPEPANRFLTLVAEAHSRSMLSEGQAARMLGYPRSLVRRLLDGLNFGPSDA